MTEMNGSATTEGIVTDERDEDLAKWEIGVLTSIFVLTIVGNGLVLFALYLRKHRSRRKFTRMYFFIMHLSIADLLTGLLDVLPQLAWDITFRFQGGPILCKLVKFLQPLGPYLSSYVLTATAVDRYRAICHPLSYCSTTSRRSRIMVYCAWIVAILLCTPQVYLFSYQEIAPHVWDCWATFHPPYGERIYVTWYSVTAFLLPFIVLVYTYIGICVGIWNSNKFAGTADLKKPEKRSSFGIPPSRTPFISKAMINTVKQTIAVISLYVITSTPFIGCLLYATWDPNAPSSPFLKGPVFTILTLLSSLTSCVNPWIYLWFNRELRSLLASYFCAWDDYALTCDRDEHRNSSARSSLITRISRYASSVVFREK